MPSDRYAITASGGGRRGAGRSGLLPSVRGTPRKRSRPHNQAEALPRRRCLRWLRSAVPDQAGGRQRRRLPHLHRGEAPPGPGGQAAVPYFTFDFTLTALAHVLNGDWYGGADFFMLQEEEKEPEELPPVCPVEEPARARALGAGVDAESALKCEETFLSGTQPGDKWEVEVIEETPPLPSA
eukprot:jgi/Mesvir1/19503/Mv20231-RA.1